MKFKSIMYSWILNHDERWSFILIYLGLAVVLSIWISLFWLVAVVAVHGLFEGIRQKAEDGEASFSLIFARSCWSIKLDLSLVIFALVLGVYMEIIMGVAGLGSAARAGAQGVKTGARFVAWEKALRAVLLSLDDLAQVLRALLRRGPELKSGRDSRMLEEKPCEVSEGRGSFSERNADGAEPWTFGDRACLFFGGICIFLLLLSPWITDHGFRGVLYILMQELHPWP
ncbi:hypothetical protein [Desulfobotulus mexicanus]|uniref:Uncharacterized protein n=1 Tax=Desulfobotulus mexicanus TaxID=2586642 RepID=A0A5S5MFH9_9BACT|nr:hypothetical protein [Desulfobotulus mexicanus]TYT74450.1 hypothetical protein FIM25_09870 [Desulfobotulus mexicanus]